MWYYHIEEYNENVIDLDPKEIERKYGKIYSNKQTRKALRVLSKFLKNMLTPIRIRDVGFNIKGECGDEYGKYIGNIEYKLIKNNEKSKITAS